MFCFFCFKQKTAYEMRISDWSSDVCSSDLTAFSRTFEMDGLQRALYLNVGEVGPDSYTETTGSVLYVYHGDARDTVTAIGVVTDQEKSLVPATVDNKYITVLFPQSAEAIEANVLMWNGPAEKTGAFLEMLGGTKPKVPDFSPGGHPYCND